jgi:hypothetical protein
MTSIYYTLTFIQAVRRLIRGKWVCSFELFLVFPFLCKGFTIAVFSISGKIPDVNEALQILASGVL